MRTEFFHKKYIHVICAFCVLFVLCAALYATALRAVKVVELYHSFYFLVTDDTHVEAGAAFVKLEGGAGYLLSYDDKEYVVLSVYLREREGETVQAALAQNGETTKLLRLSVDKLYFKRQEDKNRANTYVSALRTLYSQMSVLSECISRLEKGMTQQACKRIITPLSRQLSHLSEIYQETYPTYANVCKRAAEDLLLLQEKTVYTRDLRYVLCCLAVDYVALGERFSL